jgi:hypothetical protein
MSQLNQLEIGKAALIAVLEDIRDGRRTDLGYDQDSYGGPSSHGYSKITGCLACIAYTLEYGIEETRNQLRKCYGHMKTSEARELYLQLARDMRASARKLLGLPETVVSCHALFGTVALSWPIDLYRLYQTDRFAAAIEAINRLQPNGTFANPAHPASKPAACYVLESAQEVLVEG